MRRLLKLLDLPIAERWLLAEVGLMLLVVRVGLWLVPLGWLRRGLAGRLARSARPYVPPERIAWAVNTIAAYIPAESCLTRAVAGQALLARHGMPARLAIGVAKDARGRLVAHAWLYIDGHVLIGGDPGDLYTPLPNIEDLLW